MNNVELQDSRTLGQQQNIPRALSAREQLALTLLHDEWSNAALRMCFEVDKPEKYVTELSQKAVVEIAHFESERVQNDER